MWVLFLGDVVGKPGRRVVREFLSRIRSRRDIDLVIANGENAAGGVGMTGPAVRELFDAGVEGRGWGVFHGRSGSPYVVASLIGRVFMGQYDCPFRWMDESVPEMKRHAATVIVDFHAEATSEKRAMVFHLDGRVSAVVGTHTHVQTRDAQVMPGGTGYITDTGMCGPTNSVIGMDAGDVLRRFLTQVPTRFEVASGEAEAAGVFFEIDPASGVCRGAEAFAMSETMMRSREAWTRF